MSSVVQESPHYTFLFQNVTGYTRTSHVESLDPVC